MGRLKIVGRGETEQVAFPESAIRRQPFAVISLGKEGDRPEGARIQEKLKAFFRWEAEKAPREMARAMLAIDSYSVEGYDSAAGMVTLGFKYQATAAQGEADGAYFCHTEEEIAGVLREALLAHKQEIVILRPYEGTQMPEAHDYFEDAYRIHTEGCFNDGVYLKNCVKDIKNGFRQIYMGLCMLHYNVEYRTTLEQEEALYKAVDEVIASQGLDRPDKAVYDKITAVYRYISSEVVYDYEYQRYTAYHAMIEKCAVCMGCATLFYLFMRKLKVPAEYVAGIDAETGGRHAWNIVKLGAYWYNVDTTWENFVKGKRIMLTQGKYFLKSAEDFKDHIRDARYMTEAFVTKHPMGTKSI